MKSKNNSLYTLWSLGIILGVVLSLFALFFASCSKAETAEEKSGKNSLQVTEETSDDRNQTGGSAQAEQNPSGQSTESGNTTGSTASGEQPTPPAPTQTGARLSETPDAGTAYQDKFVFLGDSTTNGLRSYGVLSGGTATTQVWTPSSGTLTLSYQSFATIVYPETGEELTISQAIERKKPEYIMITLGVNGVSFMGEADFVREYTDLVTRIRQLSPDTKIICNSIYPVASDYPYIADINNDKITAANGWIEKVAEDTGTAFLNSFEVIVGEEGFLPQKYCNGDGIHLNPDGYNTVLDYLRTHEYK